jgi:hypothetical protein
MWCVDNNNKLRHLRDSANLVPLSSSGWDIINALTNRAWKVDAGNKSGIVHIDRLPEIIQSYVILSQGSVTAVLYSGGAEIMQEYVIL